MEQIKCYCGHTTYCDCGPLEEKSAVEWFAKELYEKFEMKGDGRVYNDLLEKAKEMEKEQKGYSEEDIRKAIFLCCNEEDSTEETILKALQQNRKI
jgi:hypothetical protein